jgi:hypothetical protein
MQCSWLSIKAFTALRAWPTLLDASHAHALRDSLWLAAPWRRSYQNGWR